MDVRNDGVQGCYHSLRIEAPARGSVVFIPEEE